MIHCGAVIRQSIFFKIFTKIFTKYSRRLPSGRGMSFVGSASDLYSASLPAVMCAIPCYIGPRYNDTPLFVNEHCSHLSSLPSIHPSRFVHILWPMLRLTFDLFIVNIHLIVNIGSCTYSFLVLKFNVCSYLIQNFNSLFIPVTGVILCMRPVNERWRYTVTPSLIGLAHTQKDPCCDKVTLIYFLFHCFQV